MNKTLIYFSKRTIKALFTSLLLFSFMANSNAQKMDKKEAKKVIKEMDKQYGNLHHKKFFKNNKWAMCKFAVVYKMTSASTASAVDKKVDYSAGGGKVKVKSSSGSYAVLHGVSEEDLQRITDKVSENFIQRMKEEAGVDIITWSDIKDVEKAEKIKEKAQDKKILSKTQGLSYASTYDNSPYYTRQGGFIPGGKKIAKEKDANAMEVNILIDFAKTTAKAEAKVNFKGIAGGSSGRDADVTDKTQQIVEPGVRVMYGTSIGGHDKSGYYVGFGISDKELGKVIEVHDKVEKKEGEIPEVLENRKNEKLENVTTFHIYTTPEKFEKAVLELTDHYFDSVIKYQNACSAKYN